MANLSNINNILRTGSLGVGINRDPLGAFEISSATKPGIKMFNTAASGKTYEAYSDANGNYIIYDQDADDNRFVINTSGNATFAGDVTSQGYTIDAAGLQTFQDFQSKPIDTDSGLFTVGGNGMQLGYTRAVSMWSSTDGVWNSWVGTNLRWDGTNFKRASDNPSANWGNIAGIRFLGNGSTSGAAMQFIIDPPEQSSAPTGEQTIGTTLPVSMTALSLNNDLSATFAGHIAVKDGNNFYGANAIAASSEDGNYVASFGKSTSGSAKFAGNITVGAGNSTFGGVVTVNNPAISPAITAISSWSGTTRNPQIKFARIASAVAGEIGYSDPETNLYIGSTTNHDFRIRVNNNDIITCDTAQNVGIGTTSPNSRLEVATSTNINNYSDGAVQVVSNSPIAFVGASNLNPSLNRWGFKIREAADGDFNIHDYRHATTRMRINISGDIQIPTNSASLQLRSSGSGSYTSIRRDAANQLIVANTAGNQVFGIGNGGELAITNGASYSGTETYSNAWNSGYQTLILGSQLSPNSVYIITINVGSGFGTPPYYASAVFTIVTAPSTNSTGGGFDNIAPTATHVNSNVYWKYRLSCISPGRNGVEAWLVNGPTNPPANPTINVKATKIMTM